MLVPATFDLANYGTPLLPSRRSLAAKPVVASTAPALQPQFSRLLDPKLGISILQFRDTDGNIAQTFPSQQQLAAYARPSAGEAPKNGALA